MCLFCVSGGPDYISAKKILKMCLDPPSGLDIFFGNISEFNNETRLQGNKYKKKSDMSDPRGRGQDPFFGYLLCINVITKSGHPETQSKHMKHALMYWYGKWLVKGQQLAASTKCVYIQPVWAISIL